MAEVLLRVGTTPQNLVDMPNPSSLKWNYQDVSMGDSGRDDTGYMYKGKVTDKIKLEVVWNAVSPEKASLILQAFKPEYIYVRYRDPELNAYRIMEAYTGDKGAPVKMWTDNQKLYETVSFDIIER